MRSEQLVADFPTLFHMAEGGSWQSIQQDGLLSTSALLDLYRVDGALREALEHAHRPASVRIQAAGRTPAVVRDQKPLNMARLAACLVDMSVSEWITHLNQRVFFWTSRRRLQRMLKAYADSTHDVLVVDTAGLVARHEGSIKLAPYNSGATVPTAVPRGSRTFLPISDYPYEEWKRKRARWDAVTEVTVEGGVQDIARYVIRVESHQGDRMLGVVWQAEAHHC